MKGKVVVALELPALDPQQQFRSFKITPRSQNAHAYVNAGFRFKVSKTFEILEQPSIVIGGINGKLVSFAYYTYRIIFSFLLVCVSVGVLQD